ncbi:hypothetical protein R1sor_015426 [Riccia sorocarpa]|uniref:FCP1 homology domain-containing protein n=1 Tax=Riccia sorocarpa TaxID=122646 RepID=A0ABD3HC76_9MARC
MGFRCEFGAGWLIGCWVNIVNWVLGAARWVSAGLSVEPRGHARAHAALRPRAGPSKAAGYCGFEQGRCCYRGAAQNRRESPQLYVEPRSPAALHRATEKKAKQERAESVEAIDDEEVVDKESSNEGPWLIKRYYKVDIINNFQWAYMEPVDISAAFVGISEFQLRRVGLRGVITRQYVPPNGQRIILTEELIRDAFFIHEELNPPASQQPFPKHVMRIALEDWFSRYDEKTKRYLAEDCVHEVWRSVFQCLQTFLLAKRMPRSITGPIIHFVKSALQHVFPEGVLLDDSDGEEDTSMGPHPKLLDLAAYQFKCIRDEMCQVKKHLEQPNNSRLRETFVGQVLTHLLIHLGIYKAAYERAAGVITALGHAALRRAARALHGPAQSRNTEPRGPAALRRAQGPATTLAAPNRAAMTFAALLCIAAPSLKIETSLEETTHRRKEEERRLEELGANAYQPRLVDPQAVRQKTLIMAFDGLLVSIRTTADEHATAAQHGWDDLQVKKGCFVVVRIGLSKFLQACLREFHLMIWTSRPKAVIDRIIRFLFI